MCWSQFVSKVKVETTQVSVEVPLLHGKVERIKMNFNYFLILALAKVETYWQAHVKKLLLLLLATSDFVRGNFNIKACQFDTYNEHDTNFKRKSAKKVNDSLNFASLQAELLISQDSVPSPHILHTTTCCCSFYFSVQSSSLHFLGRNSTVDASNRLALMLLITIPCDSLISHY